MAKGFVQLF